MSLENLKKRIQQLEWPAKERLLEIWKKILADSDARRALEGLDKAGFRISHLKPNASFKRPNWADYISALPLLPDKPPTWHIHRAASSRKYWPLVRELRELAEMVDVPFVEVRLFGREDYAISGLREDLLKAASTLERYLSWHYYVRLVNPRQALIADLRWTIRHITTRPHDGELSILIDAAFRAAGYEEPCYDPTSLDRIEKRQREMRVKAVRRSLDQINAPPPSVQSSTRIRRNSRKRV